jgi:Flp pilus assembly protein CpaB
VAGNGHAAPATGRGPERPLARRRSLPGSRSVVGAFLVAAAAVLVFAAYSGATARPRQSYVVATRALAPGTRLGPADLRVVGLDLPDPAVRGRLFASVASLVGASVVSPINAGDLVEASAVVGRAGASGTREVSLEVDRARAVAGTLKPGEYVDLLGTFGTGADAYTTVLVSHVELISVSNVNSSLGDTRTQLLTFAATTELDAEAIAHAGLAGQTTIIRSAEQANSGLAPTYRPSGPTATTGA